MAKEKIEEVKEKVKKVKEEKPENAINQTGNVNFTEA